MAVNFVGTIYEESIRAFLKNMKVEDVINSVHLADLDFDNDDIDVILACIESFYYEVLCLRNMIDKEGTKLKVGKTSIMDEYIEKIIILNNLITFEPIATALACKIKRDKKDKIYNL